MRAGLAAFRLLLVRPAGLTTVIPSVSRRASLHQVRAQFGVFDDDEAFGYQDGPREPSEKQIALAKDLAMKATA